MKDGNMGILMDWNLLWNVMIQGNPGALTVVEKMLKDPDPRHMFDIVYLEGYDIRGPRLWQFYSDGADKNYDKFSRTIFLMRMGVFTEEEVNTNLDMICAIPFINDDIIIEGVPAYGEDFGLGHEKWEEYCLKQKESFNERLSEALETDKRRKGIIK